MVCDRSTLIHVVIYEHSHQKHTAVICTYARGCGVLCDYTMYGCSIRMYCSYIEYTNSLTC